MYDTSPILRLGNYKGATIREARLQRPVDTKSSLQEALLEWIQERNFPGEEINEDLDWIYDLSIVKQVNKRAQELKAAIILRRVVDIGEVDNTHGASKHDAIIISDEENNWNLYRGRKSFRYID